MSDESAVPETEPGQPETLGAMLAEMRAMKARAEAATVAAEEANRKANSEAGFAFNAKTNAEEHAKLIAQLKGTVEAELNWLSTTKKNIDETANAIVVQRGGVESDVRLVGEAKTAADGALAALQASKDRGDTVLSTMEGARDESGKLLKRVAEDTAAVNQNRAAVEANATTVQTLQAQVTEAAAKAQTECTAIVGRGAEAQTQLKSITEATSVAQDTFARVQKYEQDLERLSGEFNKLHAKIESLLPGATSAGLASAFRDQKSRFDRPQIVWLVTFVLAIIGLLAVGLYGFEQFVNEAVNWDSTLRHVVSRLPLIVPLVWLALYAGRNYMLALRLQEDYAFKEATSTSFEGYRREMAAIPASSEQLLPILNLCESVLKTLGQRPGRLYDGKHEDVTPLTPLMKLIRESGLLKDKTPGSE